jgi:hypothetical protein
LFSPVAGHRFKPSFKQLFPAHRQLASSISAKPLVVALLSTRGPLFRSSSVVHRFVCVCFSSPRPPLLELVLPSNRFRPPLLATGYVVHLQFVASFTTADRHLYLLCSRHLSTLAAVDYSSFVRVSSRVLSSITTHL